MEKLKIIKIKQKSLRWWRYLFSGEKSTGANHIVWQPSEFAREKCTSPYVAPQRGSSSFLRIYLCEQRTRVHVGRPQHTRCTQRNTRPKIHAYAILSRSSIVKMQEKNPGARSWQCTELWSSGMGIWRTLLQLSFKGCTSLCDISNDTGFIAKLKSVNVFKVFKFFRIENRR